MGVSEGGCAVPRSLAASELMGRGNVMIASEGVVRRRPSKKSPFSIGNGSAMNDDVLWITASTFGGIGLGWERGDGLS